MKQSKLKELSKEQLMIEFYRTIVRSVHQTNSVRGLTKKQAQCEDNIIKELCSRFELKYSEIKSILDGC